MHIDGWCPCGCGQTLYVAAAAPGTPEMPGRDSQVMCSAPDCPQPDAVARILAEQDSEHQVTLTESGFSVIHPLRERLDDALLHCTLHYWLENVEVQPQPPGRYRVISYASPGVDVDTVPGFRHWRWEEMP